MLIRNFSIALALGFFFIGFAAWQYKETGGPAVHQRLREQRDEKAQKTKLREKDPMALASCQKAATAFVRNPATIDWNIWNSDSTYTGGGVWVHRIPLTAQNDMGVRKSVTAVCQTVGPTVVGLELR